MIIYFPIFAVGAKIIQLFDRAQGESDFITPSTPRRSLGVLAHTFQPNEMTYFANTKRQRD